MSTQRIHSTQSSFSLQPLDISQKKQQKKLQVEFVHSNSNYEQALSTFSKKMKVEKQSKSPKNGVQQELVKEFQEQIKQLKAKINELTIENTRLKQMQDKSFNKIKERHERLNSYSAIVQQVQQIRIENIQLKQKFSQMKMDYQISVSSLKELFNHIINIPSNQIKDILTLRLSQQDDEIKRLKNQVELLSLERDHFFEDAYALENKLVQQSQQQLLFA